MNKRRYGFTIVELLIVIVVIAVLAAITVVVYRGISTRAIESTLQHDASEAAKQISKDNIDTGLYPISTSAANNGKGLAKSGNNAYQYTVNNAGNKSFCLTVVNPSLTTTYYVTNIELTPRSGICSGHVSNPSGASSPVITLQPASWVNYSHTFTASATGSPAPTVQWQNSVDDSTWTNITGATTTSYNATGGSCETYVYYRALFTNSTGVAASNSAYLTGSCS